MVLTSVLFETLWHDYSDGWSIASRAYARALAASGVAVQLRSWMAALEEPSPEVLAEVGHLLHPLPGERDFYLFSCTLSGLERASYSIDKLQRVSRPRAFYTMFERCQVEPVLAASLNELDGVMVPCSANLDALRAAGCTTASYVPYPYFPDDPHLALPPPRREPRSFLWVGRWEPRKAPHRLVEAFLLAFGPGEATLTLKVGHVPWPGYPEPEEAVAAALGDPRVASRWKTVRQVDEAVRLVRGRLSPAQMLALHASADVYTSASRGEGIDLPSMSAKCASRRVVTTDSGGPRDFLTETDILVPKTGEVPCEARYRWGPGATFADHDVEALAAALQTARADTRPPERISPRFAAENVGREFRAWVEGITSRVPREVREKPLLANFAAWLESEG